LLSDVQTYRQMSTSRSTDPTLLTPGDDAALVIGDDSETDLELKFRRRGSQSTVDVVIGTNNWLVMAITLSEMYLSKATSPTSSASLQHLRILGRRGRQLLQ